MFPISRARHQKPMAKATLFLVIRRATFAHQLRLGTSNSKLPLQVPVGLYKILLLEFMGDTRGNPWYANMTCVAIGSDGHPLYHASDVWRRVPAEALK
jgi:hypothetical protein